MNKLISMSIVFILLVTFVSCGKKDNLADCYIRQDKNIAKCIEIDKEAKKAYLFNYEKDIGMVKYVMSYEILEDQINFTMEDGTVVKYAILENTIKTNIMTNEGYQDIIYDVCKKEDFNKLMNKLE